MSATWAEIRARKNAREIEVPLTLDDDPALDELDRARRTLRAAEARSARNPSDEDAAAAVCAARAGVDAAIEAAREHVAVFTVRSIGRAAFEELRAKYGPTLDAGSGTAKPTSPDEDDEYTAQMLAACVASPDLTLDDAREFITAPEWSRGEVLQILEACFKVNAEHRRVDLGNS
ncbi:MAG: hypothetical protein AAGA99_27310 [Actinomycetota bacterium]